MSDPDWQHLARYVAQEAARVLPDLEMLERDERQLGRTWTADQIGSRARVLRAAIEAANKGKQ